MHIYIYNDKIKTKPPKKHYIIQLYLYLLLRENNDETNTFYIDILMIISI
jgi:hypothetical protein